jgi:transposase
MGNVSLSDDFERDAVRQMTERGYPVAEVWQRMACQPAFSLRVTEDFS